MDENVIGKIINLNSLDEAVDLNNSDFGYYERNLYKFDKDENKVIKITNIDYNFIRIDETFTMYAPFIIIGLGNKPLYEKNNYSRLLIGSKIESNDGNSNIYKIYDNPVIIDEEIDKNNDLFIENYIYSVKVSVAKYRADSEDLNYKYAYIVMLNKGDIINLQNLHLLNTSLYNEGFNDTIDSNFQNNQAEKYIFWLRLNERTKHVYLNSDYFYFSWIKTHSVTDLNELLDLKYKLYNILCPLIDSIHMNKLDLGGKNN